MFWPDWAPACSSSLLYGIKAGLTHWFPVEQSHFLFLFYPVIGIILASLFVKYVVKDNISEGVTRVLYAMSRKNSYIAPTTAGLRS